MSQLPPGGFPIMERRREERGEQMSRELP